MDKIGKTGTLFPGSIQGAETRSRGSFLEKERLPVFT